jgi:hypothetical protein
MKKWLTGNLSVIFNKLSSESARRLAAIPNSRSGIDERQIQILLSLKYKELARGGSTLPPFSDVEFSCFSQNGEDGILLCIFSLIGTTNKQVVEICAGAGIECNAANLIINHGWDGLLFDGNSALINKGKAFYSQRNNAWRFRRLPPKLIHAWVTCENVNDLIHNNGFTGEVDLLSIDMDGVDWWIWKAINCINPRVVIIEYNNRWNAEQSVTIPYYSDFAAQDTGPSADGYFGASLSAYNKLAGEKGYRLVGANSPNTNAIFIRDDIGRQYFPEVTVASCLSSCYAIYQHKTKYPRIKNKPIMQV